MKALLILLLSGLLAAPASAQIIQGGGGSGGGGGTTAGFIQSPTVTAGAATLGCQCLAASCTDTNRIANGTNVGTLALTTCTATGMHDSQNVDIEVNMDGTHAPSSITVTGGAGVTLDYGVLGNTFNATTCGAPTATNKVKIRWNWNSATGNLTLLGCTPVPAPTVLAASFIPASCTDQWAVGAIAQTFTAGHTYCPNAVGTYTFAAASAVNVNNVTIYCSNRGMILQRTGATDGFDLSGVNDRIIGCTIDGNSQSGSGTGPLVSITGTDALVEYNNFQNEGLTNTTSATVNIASGASRANILYNLFASDADQVIGINATSAGSSAIADTRIIGNSITFAPGTASLSGILMRDNNGSAAVTGAHIDGNNIIASGSNATAIDFTGGSVNAASATRDNELTNNLVSISATLSIGIKYFFTGQGNLLSGNKVEANGHVTSHDYSGGDVYDSVISNNIDINAGQGDAFTCADCARSIWIGNRIENVDNNAANFGLIIESVGGTGANATADNLITGNEVRLSAAAGTCYGTDAGGSGDTHSNHFEGNHCVGTGTAGQTGLKILATSATVATNNYAIANSFNNLPTGISVGAGESSTNIGQNIFQTVTTAISDSGTNTVGTSINFFTEYCATLATSALTNFCPASGRATLDATETGAGGLSTLISNTTTIRNLRCFFTATQGSAKSDAITFRKCPAAASCANTTVTCTATNAQTCSDTTHSFQTVAGDTIDIQDVTTGSAITARDGTCAYEADTF